MFDADLPCALTFIRSLGRAGVPVTVYSHRPRASGRYSRYAEDFRPCPDVAGTDAFVAWLADEMTRGEIDLVAPTTDALVFCLAEAHARLGRAEPGHPAADALHDCLFKDRFAERMAEVGFPTAPWAAPTDQDEALVAAERIGYPVVLKPRSHVAVGLARGTVAHDPTELLDQFTPYPIADGHDAVTRLDDRLAWPIMQRYFPRHQVDVVSVSGCLDGDGEVMALGHSRKLESSPPRLGTGTRFEALEHQPFTSRATEAVRRLIGRGLFELEVLVHHPSGRMWAIDLNPRGHGQIELEVGQGRDLPLLWYEAVTGVRLVGRRPRRRPPRYWQAGIHYYVGSLIAVTVGPRRSERASDLVRAAVTPKVGAFLDWSDPCPALVNVSRVVRHPRALVRPFLEHRREASTTD